MALNSISGVLVVQNAMPTATMTITKIATSQQVYSGDVTPKSIPTGAGTIRVVVSQFSKSVTKDIQVAGETIFDLGEDVVTVNSPSESVTCDINGTPVSVSEQYKIIKGASATVHATFGNWANGTEIEGTKTVTFSQDMTIGLDYSNHYIITESGSFIVPTTKSYQIILVGGGSGGNGGNGGTLSSGCANGGDGGNGGNGGEVRGYQTAILNKNDSVSVTIGTGGSGGTRGTGARTPSSSIGGTGGIGGTTIFGSFSAPGGEGVAQGTHLSPALSKSGNGGNGGNGANGTNMTIFGQSKAYGAGGTGGYGAWLNEVLGSGGDWEKTEATNGTAGSAGQSGIDWLSNVGDGGNGANGADNNTSSIHSQQAIGGSGGQGGYGFGSYGRGGTGGTGGRVSGGYPNYTYGNGTAGSDGSNGAIAIRAVLS